MMIEINLLPDEIKVKSKAASRADPASFIAPIVIGLLAVLVLSHAALGVFSFVRNFQSQGLKKETKELGAQKNEYISKGLAGFPDLKTIDGLLKRRIDWAKKLNALSRNLPPGIWFNELQISAKELVINGSVVSLKKEEMALLNNFMQALQKDPGFFDDFSSISLGPVQRRRIASYAVMDFTLNCTLKSR